MSRVEIAIAGIIAGCAAFVLTLIILAMLETP